MSTVLHTAPVSTNTFTYDAATRTFSAFASDLPPFGRVYADSCDEGLTLVSARTGREITVGVVDDIRRDGEVVGWVLKPCTRRAAEPTFTVVVYND
jgi:hypothetical protein